MASAQAEQHKDDAVGLKGVTVNLTVDDVDWLDRRSRRTAESRSTILRTIIRDIREREASQS